jgi:uncharacterized membrane protein YeaQ/YmgE (transglycosylase-associated protein family)
MMGIFLWIVVGLAAGSVARWVMPGPDPLGLLGTIVLGMGGGVVGGLLGLAFGGTMAGFDFLNLMTAIIGSLILLMGYRSYAMRGAA